MTPHQFCTFRVGPHRLGVSVSRVQEVLRSLPTTRIPGASSVVKGLINLRGEVVVAIDLAHRLGMQARAEPTRKLNVVVSTDDGPVSLLVDEVGDVVEITDELCVPQQTRPDEEGLISATYPLPDSLLLVLDIEAITDISDQLGRAELHAVS